MPSVPVEVWRVSRVPAFRIVTLAPGTTPPVASLTVPDDSSRQSLTVQRRRSGSDRRKCEHRDDGSMTTPEVAEPHFREAFAIVAFTSTSQFWTTVSDRMSCSGALIDEEAAAVGRHVVVWTE